MTLTTQLVLRALLAEPGREMYGREIMQAASLATGTVYPILARLEAEGWISVRDEKIDKRAEGRPARRYYRLTASGVENAGAAMARASSQLSRLGLDPPAQVPPLKIGGIEIPVLADDRQPPGIGPDLSDWLSPEDSAYDEPARDPGNCGHPRVHVKGTCPDCLTYVTSKP